MYQSTVRWTVTEMAVELVREAWDALANLVGLSDSGLVLIRTCTSALPSYRIRYHYSN